MDKRYKITPHYEVSFKLKLQLVCNSYIFLEQYLPDNIVFYNYPTSNNTNFTQSVFFASSWKFVIQT